MHSDPSPSRQLVMTFALTALCNAYRILSLLLSFSSLFQKRSVRKNSSYGELQESEKEEDKHQEMHLESIL